MITAVCLLAGFSKRMGKPKQHVQLGQKTFAEHIITSLQANARHISAIIMVGQADDRRGQELAKANNAFWIANLHPEAGPLSSIKLALQHIQPGNAMLMWPVDHPLVSPNTVKALCEKHFQAKDRIIVPSIDNRRGHPSIFPAQLLNEFSLIPEEEGARWLLKAHPDKIEHVVTEDVWTRKNLNTPELLNEARQYLESLKAGQKT